MIIFNSNCYSSVCAPPPFLSTHIRNKPLVRYGGTWKDSREAEKATLINRMAVGTGYMDNVFTTRGKFLRRVITCNVVRIKAHTVRGILLQPFYWISVLAGIFVEEILFFARCDGHLVLNCKGEMGSL